MADGVVTIVTQGIKLLGGYYLQQANHLSGVGYQVKLAEVELHLMRGFLKDADSRIGDDEVVRIWVGLIRDVAYDLEDVIESFALKMYRKRREGGQSTSIMKIVLKGFACIFGKGDGDDLHKIGYNIDDIMAKLAHLRSSLQSYNIRQISGSSSSIAAAQQETRLTYGHQVETHIVGLTEMTDKLVKQLVREGSRRHLVVSIWGMGGCGKTTLAKQVFHHIYVKRRFDCIAWICVSQQWDGKDVLEEILIKLTSPTKRKREEISKMKKDEIAEKLCSVQREKRCLVVVDDIWTREAWDSIKPGFPINEETQSRVLVTTRKKEVALVSSGDDHIHKPQPLDEKQSWELLEKIVMFGSGKTRSDVYARKKELGKKMFVHCTGLPLAINVIGSLLTRHDEIEEWEAVLKNVNKYIMRGKNVVGRGKTDQEYGVSGVLGLSYDDLPSHLKLCFLYLAQFPEDHEIRVKRLTQLWIAEGFIVSTTDTNDPSSSSEEETLEDVAYGCLIELVERSMVQVVQYGLTGNVRTCRLHDLMRDWCLRKAKEESFVEIRNFSSGQPSKNAPIGKVRRRALYFDRNVKDEFDEKDERYAHIRSLSYFVPGRYFDPNWSKKVMQSVFTVFLES